MKSGQGSIQCHGLPSERLDVCLLVSWSDQKGKGIAQTRVIFISFGSYLAWCLVGSVQDIDLEALIYMS